MSVLRHAATLLLLAGSPALAQTAPTRLTPGLPPADACTYAHCALSIAPAWNALDVVNGATGVRVASLGFFWPRRVDASFAGNDSATFYASRAFQVRRTAAVFTDVGAVLLGYAAVRQLRGGLHGNDRVIGAIGAGAFAVGVPLQFSADGLLSRAVWWHNGRYAR
jgi:hypothetical protein